MSTSLSVAGRPGDGRPGGDDSRHTVQFYEHDDFLVARVVDFVTGGTDRGEPVVVIATAAHGAAFRQQLVRTGLDVEECEKNGSLTILDAAEILEKIMVGDRPDRRLYREVVGGVLGSAAQMSTAGHFRAYGEMVDLLWRAGKRDAAIALEELWNEIGSEYSFSLLCAYVMDNFRSESDAAGFEEVCRTHSKVVPTERYVALEDADARLREISVLQQRARALESEIAHRKQVENELRDAVKVRDDFLCVAGHELRTPLTVLRLQLASLLENDIASRPPRTQRRLAALAAQTERLSRLAERLVDASQMGTDGLALRPESMDLAALARDTAEGLADVATAAGCRVTVLGDSSVAGCWDRDRLNQVLQDLLSNSFKFGRGTEVHLVVKSLPEHVELVVRDGGVGVPLGERERIFERFVRAAPTESFGGLGLGLWIARRIVEAHGGDIRLDSSPATDGAAFRVTLPYAAVPPA